MTNKSNKIMTEISAGELFDKISILEIKIDKIQDKKSLVEVHKEYSSLKETQNLNVKLTPALKNLINELKEINLKLWDIEDNKRVCEKNKNFGEIFIGLLYQIFIPTYLKEC